jgi:hypothetical protein
MYQDAQVRKSRYKIDFPSTYFQVVFLLNKSEFTDLLTKTITTMQRKTKERAALQYYRGQTQCQIISPFHISPFTK